MLTHDDLKKRLQIYLQDYPEIALRYSNGDPTVTAMLQAIAGMIADQSQDIDTAITEPFIKSNVRTILADATNKGILPLGTPCQHYLDIENKGASHVALSTGRLIEDLQGRVWRIMQDVSVDAGALVKVQAEQSEVKSRDYQVIYSEPFHKVDLDIDDDLHLSAINIKDGMGNIYQHFTRWMNCDAGEYAFNLKTDSLRKITVEFGDSERCGVTLQANSTMTFELILTDGYVDTLTLREAALQEVTSNAEGKLQLKFSDNGLIRSGSDPLSIEEMRLLASYPTYDPNAVFLGNFDYMVRKTFMSRCRYLAVWNEAIQDKYYGASFDDINRLQVAFVAKNEVDKIQIGYEIKQLIGELDSLYLNRVKVNTVETRPFKLQINARLAPVHNADSVKNQIISLLLARFGQDSLASSYFIPDGFNSQEISDSIRKNIAAFQDHISDFSLLVEDVSINPIQPHQWTFLTEQSITIDIKRTAVTGANLWAN